MSFKKIHYRQEKLPFLILLQFFFLLFMAVSCAESNFAFPSPNPEVWCTFNVTFNKGTSPTDIEKDKTQLKDDVEQNTKSSEEGITCLATPTWKKIDDYHWQLEITMNCFRSSDTSAVRPPAGTKPPPGRLSYGTIEKSGCPDDGVKK